MAKTREQKEEIIKDLAEKIGKQKAMVFVDFSSLPSAALFDLREKLQAADCCLKVAKKTLLEKVLEKLGRQELAEKIKGLKVQLALAFGFSDELMPAKICAETSKENENLKILGAAIGDEFLEREQVIELAQFSSKKEILARLIGGMTAPLTGFVNVLQANIKGLIYVFGAIKENK